jgi:carbonic anhydrase
MRDLPASLVVFLIATPLSMGIALASGAPIVSGLIAAVVGGIVVGLLSGAPLQVSGPAAGLSVIVFGYIEQFGLSQLCAIVVMAGLLQMILGALRVARIAMGISPAVIHGMLAGIGIQIALSQLHIILGGAPQSSAIQNVVELPGQIVTIHTPSAVVGLATLVVLLLWPRIPGKLSERVPAPLVAVVGATLAAVSLQIDVARVELPGNVLSAIAPPTFPARASAGQLTLAVLTLTFVASAESLLCAVATDKLHDGPRVRLNRELFAQGAGNACSGLLGGLPVTGVIVRSSANVGAGARTRASAVLHGVWVLLFATALGFVLTLIPLSALAALLVSVGVKLVKAAPVRASRNHGEAAAYFITLSGVVLVNLLVGIALGVTWLILRLLWRRTRMSASVRVDGEHVHVVLRGALTFVRVPTLVNVLADLPEGRTVDVDLDVDIVDHAAFEALHAFRADYEKRGGRVDLDLRHYEPRRSSKAA